MWRIICRYKVEVILLVPTLFFAVYVAHLVDKHSRYGKINHDDRLRVLENKIITIEEKIHDTK